MHVFEGSKKRAKKRVFGLFFGVFLCFWAVFSCFWPKKGQKRAKKGSKNDLFRKNDLFYFFKKWKKIVSESGGHIFWTPFWKRVKNPMSFRWWQKAVFPHWITQYLVRLFFWGFLGVRADFGWEGVIFGGFGAFLGGPEKGSFWESKTWDHNF